MRRVIMMAIALLVIAVQGVAQQVFTFSDGRTCTMEGDARGAAGKALNRLKNRFNAPAPAQIRPNVTLARMLAPGDDLNRFQSSGGATVTGYVIDVKVGGNETCNCHEQAPVDRDTHVELALSPNAPSIQRVIVEVTPRLRARMRQGGIDWTTEGLQRTILKHWVRVTGWLMFDTMHVNEAENTNPGDPVDWRATCWELHPVTGIAPTTAPRALVPLEALATAHRQRRASLGVAALQKIRQRNAALLAAFPPGDRDRD